MSVTGHDGGRDERVRGPEPWPLPIRLELSETPDDDKTRVAERALRGRPGVAVMLGRGEGGELAVSVNACGDLRAFVAGRLRGDGPRPDLSTVVDVIEACECGSGFEADLACDAVAQARLPEDAARAAAQRAVCFVHLDPEGPAPACRVIEDLGTPRTLDPGTLIGPFAARSRAEAWASMLDDRFELCRKPSLLVGQPNAMACEYKDMGRCPAPCDGSEPMDTYRERARAALAFDGAAWEAEAARLDTLVKRAASEMDFERAAEVRERRESLGPMPAAGVLTRMHRYAIAVVMPAGRKGWARLFVHAKGVTRLIADVRAEVETGTAASLLLAAASDRAESGGADWADAVAIVHRRMLSKRAQRGICLSMIDVLAPETPEDRRYSFHQALRSAVRRAAGVEVEPSDETDAGALA